MNGQEKKKEVSKVQQVLACLTPLEKLYLANEIARKVTEEEDKLAVALGMQQLSHESKIDMKSLIVLMAKNPMFLDAVVTLQNEVIKILDKPDILTQESRDPFTRNISKVYADDYEFESDSEPDRRRQTQTQAPQDVRVFGVDNFESELLDILTYPQIKQVEDLKKKGINPEEYISTIKRMRQSGSMWEGEDEVFSQEGTTNNQDGMGRDSRQHQNGQRTSSSSRNKLQTALNFGSQYAVPQGHPQGGQVMDPNHYALQYQQHQMYNMGYQYMPPPGYNGSPYPNYPMWNQNPR